MPNISIEPATLQLLARRSNQLNYMPTCNIYTGTNEERNQRMIFFDEIQMFVFHYNQSQDAFLFVLNKWNNLS